MKKLALGLLALPIAASAACDWTSPGDRPYIGDVPSAVDSYTDIPAPVRQRLKALMERQAYSDIISIKRDTITGRHNYSPDLRDMHWRDGLCRGVVDRSKWLQWHEEAALVYCVESHCVAVPAVCRNVTRVTRLPAYAGPQRTAGEPVAPIQLAGPSDEPRHEIAGGSGITARAMPFLLPDPTITPVTFEPQPSTPPVVAQDDPLPFSTFPIEHSRHPVVMLSAPVPPVPEPSAMLMLALGVAAVVWRARRADSA